MEEAPAVNSNINKKENIFIALSNSGENIITILKEDNYIIFKTYIFINNIEKTIEKKLEYNDLINYYNFKVFDNIDLIYDELCKICNEKNIIAKEVENSLILSFPLKDEEDLIIKLVEKKEEEVEEEEPIENINNLNYNCKYIDNDKRFENLEKKVKNYEKRIIKLENEIINLKKIINKENNENNNKNNNFNYQNKNEINIINELNNNKNDITLNNNNDKDKIINNNFSKNNIFDFKKTKTLSYHKKCVNYLLLLKDNRLASVSDDNNLIVYNLTKNEIELQIEIHSSPVKYITQFDDGIIATTSLDKSIKLFTINENNEIKTIQSLYGHSGPVYKIIKLTNNYFASCGEDQNIKLWNKENDIYNNTINIHLDGLQINNNNNINMNKRRIHNNNRNTIMKYYDILQIKENEIITLGNDFNNSGNDSIYFWNFVTQQNIADINFQNNYNDNTTVKNNNIILFDYSKLIYIGKNYLYVIGLDNYNIINSISIEGGFLNSIERFNNNNMFLTGDNNGDLWQWNFNSKISNFNLIGKKQLKIDKNNENNLNKNNMNYNNNYNYYNNVYQENQLNNNNNKKITFILTVKNGKIITSFQDGNISILE